MSSPLEPISRQAVLQDHLKQYDRGVRDGSLVPFVYPMGTYGAAILLLFLLIPPSSSLHSRFTRYLTFAIVFAWHAWLVCNCKGYSPAVSFGIGIIAGWGTLWAATLLIFTDAKVDFKRIAQKKNDMWSTQASKANGGGLLRIGQDKEQLRQRLASPQSSTSHAQEANGNIFSLSQTRQTIEPSITYFWETYPNRPLKRRVDWVADIVSSFRGMGWNWRVSGNPTVPIDVQQKLRPTTDNRTGLKDYSRSRAGICRFDTYRRVVMHNLWLLVKGYIAIDILMTMMSLDPYFWGQTKSPAPTYMPLFIQESASLTRCYRLVTTMCMIWIPLRTIFCLGPLFFVGVIGSGYLGTNGEPWMYPDQFGSYANVFDRGLAGWWGAWWHQMFRFAFEAAGKWFSAGLGLDPKSETSKSLQLFVAFFLSGCLHACGSVTQMGDTRPLQGPFLFFMLQPVGILVEMQWRRFLKRSGMSSRIPRIAGSMASFFCTHLWFYITGPLITDDFAKGVFLFEPIMLSPLRGLGFGGEGDRYFFRWGGRVATWHTGRNLLLTGIAL